MAITFQVLGVKELVEKTNRIKAAMLDRSAYEPYIRAARMLRDAAQRNAPRLRYPQRSNFDPATGKAGATWRAGQLRRSIIAFLPRFSGTQTYGPAAYARVNVFKGRERAPHAHLIHAGTAERAPKSARMMVFPASRGMLRATGKRFGDLVFSRRVRGVRADPFFKEAVSSTGPNALESAAREQQELIDRAME